MVSDKTRKHTFEPQTQHLVANVLTSSQSEKRHNLCLTWKRFYTVLSIKEVFHLSNYTTSEWQCPSLLMFRWLWMTLIVGFFFLNVW